MQYRRLGRSELQVSAVCLGTMTWGEQNGEADAHAQLDLARDRGVTLIDTAEMYPTPPRAETAGRTERCIGTWLKARGGRDRIVLATKAVGRGEQAWLRGGTVRETRLDRAQIEAAVEGSLRRLQTDYIDLYQPHWPDRATNTFGKLGYAHRPHDDAIPLEETLGVLADLVRAGKVRAIGLSNETPWGLMHALRLHEREGLPRPASVQNPYNLLNRSFEIGLAEVAHREEVPLLAYSPLAMATLAGKYLDGARPPGARLTLHQRFQRYQQPEAAEPIRRYVALARASGLDPAQMALAFVASRSFVAATILGATGLAQLEADIAGCAMTLPEDVLREIEAIHRSQPNPCP